MMPSYGASFGTGRLGNQMSTFASIYAYERMYGIKGFVTAVQAEVLEAYFNFQGTACQNLYSQTVIAAMRCQELYFRSEECSYASP